MSSVINARAGRRRAGLDLLHHTMNQSLQISCTVAENDTAYDSVELHGHIGTD